MQEVIEELNSKINELTIENDRLKLENQKYEYTIGQANNKINRLTNLLNLWIDKKNNVFEETQPKSPNLENEQVDGSMTRVEKFYKYVYKCEKEDIDWWIDKLNEQIISLTKYVESELKRIGEYEPLKVKIIKLREEKNMKIKDIAEATHYSERQIKRICKEYTKKRYINN